MEFFLKFVNLNGFENGYEGEKRVFYVIYKEDFLKKISFCRSRIDNVIYIYFDLNLVFFYIFNVLVFFSLL